MFRSKNPSRGWPSRFFSGMVLMALLAGCAEGDSLFSDASNVHSGTYERDLAAKQATLDQEHSRSAALGAERQELQGRSQQLDQEIARQRQRINDLQAKIAQLDRQTQQMRAETTTSEKKRAELQSQIAGLKSEIDSLQKQVASNPSASELEALKQKERELSRVYSDLLKIYKSM